MTGISMQLRTQLDRERGQTMAEYAVVLGVISVVIVGALTAIAGGVSGGINTIAGFLP